MIMAGKRLGGVLLGGFLLLFAPACRQGGGGGGTPSPLQAPHLVSASFYGENGSDIVPDPGERVRLSFDQPVLIAPGISLRDTDVTLSGGGSLGTGDLVMEQENPFTLDVILGKGAAFTPGSTRMDLAAGQAAVLSRDGSAAAPYKGVEIQAGTPEVGTLTIGDIPPLLNGTGPAEGTLLVPTSGFPIDLSWKDRDGGEVDLSTLGLFATVPLSTPSGAVQAGVNLLPFLEETKTAPDSRRLIPGQGVSFPEGAFILWATVKDKEGKVSPRAALELRAAEATDDMRPFETKVNPSQVWYIDLDRDREGISSSGSATITITVAETPNGIPDFREDLEILGLRSDSPLFTDLGDGTHPNDFLEKMVEDALLENLSLIFKDTRVTFTFTRPGPLPPNLETPYNEFGFSRIAVGGASESGALGLAFMDRHNANQDDDGAWPGSSPPFRLSLGVFPTELIRFSVNLSPTSSFRADFDPLMPGRGTPAGEGTKDLSVLRYLAGLASSTTDPDRADVIENACRDLGRFLAVVLSHEVGHSMGLVADGAPPTGLYGNLPSAFPGSDSGHIDLSFSGLYPLAAQNIMAPSISYQAALSLGTTFNPLNRAWLREQVLYFGNIPAGGAR